MEARLSDTASPPPMGETQECLIFTTAGEDFAFEIGAVCEIRDSEAATPLPFTPDYVLGVVNLRGTVLPVIDLAQRLGLSPDTTPARQVVIVVSDGTRRMGVRVDAVRDILPLSVTERLSPSDLLAEVAGPFIGSIALKDEAMMRVLDATAILPPASEESAA